MGAASLSLCRLNAKLNYIPGEGGEAILKPVEEGGLFQKYEEELEINDFPQQARYLGPSWCHTGILMMSS